MPQRVFREYLTAQGLSTKTIRIYLAAIRRAEAACGPLDGVTATDLAAYAHDRVPAAYSSRRQLRAALKWWWAMTGRPHPPLNAVRVPPKPRYRCKALTEEDARAVVKTAVGWYPEGLAVLFGMYLALRSAEVASAHMSRFDDGLGWYTVTGKRDVTATLPVHPVLAAEVAGRQGWVFPGYQGREHVAPQTVWNWIRRVADTAGISEKVWPHRLRHTALATANDRTGDLRSVADFARHRDVTTTMIYTRTLERNLRRVSDALEYL